MCQHTGGNDVWPQPTGNHRRRWIDRRGNSRFDNRVWEAGSMTARSRLAADLSSAVVTPRSKDWVHGMRRWLGNDEMHVQKDCH